MSDAPIDLDDIAVLNLLHDGVIVAVARPFADAPDDLAITVEIDYLRARLSPPGSAIRVRLAGCGTVAYEPYEGAPVSALDEIAAHEPEIVEVVRDGDAVRVWGSTGCLILRYAGLTLMLDDGTPLSRAELASAARAYWDDWRRRWS